MKYVFLGTPEFAAIILEKLIKAGLPPLAVVTNPDRPTGRKKIITAPPVKQTAGKYSVLQPEKINSAFIKQVGKLGAEIAVLAAYGKIVPKELIDIFPKGIVGIHPSLLPKYRGATPIQSAILNGDEVTGTTLFLLDEKVDHGPILANFEFRISNLETYETLSKKLAEISADVLIKTLSEYLCGDIKPRPQDETKATYTKKFSAEDGYVDLEKDDPIEIWRKVRALNPEPGVFTIKDNKRMKILGATLENGRLILKKIQYEGKKPQVIGARLFHE